MGILPCLHFWNLLSQSSSRRHPWRVAKRLYSLLTAPKWVLPLLSFDKGEEAASGVSWNFSFFLEIIKRLESLAILLFMSIKPSRAFRSFMKKDPLASSLFLPLAPRGLWWQQLLSITSLPRLQEKWMLGYTRSRMSLVLRNSMTTQYTYIAYQHCR